MDLPQRNPRERACSLAHSDLERYLLDLQDRYDLTGIELLSVITTSGNSLAHTLRRES